MLFRSLSRNQGKPVSGLRQWSLDVQSRSNHNKASCAQFSIANKIARIGFATLRDGEHYRDGTAQRLERKMLRERVSRCQANPSTTAYPPRGAPLLETGPPTRRAVDKPYCNNHEIRNRPTR